MDDAAPRQRGYFGIGVEGISKPFNLGAVFRTAHAFGASFVFTVAASYERRHGAKVDTSDAVGALPFYRVPTPDALTLPQGCQLVGVEITEDAIALPSFRHPRQAAYILGAERFGLSSATLERCAHVVKIPARFSVNLGIAGALVMYDRMLSMGRFAERPVGTGGPVADRPPHRHGGPVFRSAETLAELEAMARWRAPAADTEPATEDLPRPDSDQTPGKRAPTSGRD